MSVTSVTPDCQLYRGNCFDLMATMADGSVDSIICDPPFMNTALKFDQTKLDLAKLFSEFKRITTPTAPIIIFSAGLFTVDLISEGRSIYRYDLVWQKTMPVGFLKANARPLRNHEMILVFSKSGYPTYNPQKTPMTQEAKPRQYKEQQGLAAHYRKHQRTTTYDDGSRYPKSVLTFSNGHGGKETLHPTQKPLELLRYLVRTYSNPGDLVFDAFSGSSTTAHACLLENRRFIGAELDEAYFERSIKRLNAVKAQPKLLELV
jgi:site-specific DNA-methyltransferase (adenine-specific)